MDNKYWEKAKAVESKYENVLKNLMNECRKQIIEAEDIYNEKALGKKQNEILDKFMKEINKVQAQYVDDMEKMIAHEALMIKAMKEDKPKDNMARLVDALELNNKIQMNQVRMATMNESELFSLMENQQDEVIFNLAKNAIYNLSKDLDNGAELRQKARMMNLVTDEGMLNEVAQQVRLDKANQSELLVGMSMADKLHVTKKGNIRAFLSQDIKNIEVRE